MPPTPFPLNQLRPAASSTGCLFLKTTKHLETIITKTDEGKRTLFKELSPIASEITWGYIARNYMGKSSSWMYNKLQGRDGNGGPGGFTPAEVEQLREALLAFSRRVGEVALSL